MRMKRYNVTLDDETRECLKRWKLTKQMPGSEVIRLAVKEYTRWKKAELQPKQEDFDGIDITYE
jgi:hypothetical protein